MFDGHYDFGSSLNDIRRSVDGNTSVRWAIALTTGIVVVVLPMVTIESFAFGPQDSVGEASVPC